MIPPVFHDEKAHGTQERAGIKRSEGHIIRQEEKRWKQIFYLKVEQMSLRF